MMMNYLLWIDEQINMHQTEIARLMVARGVIEDASADAKPKAEKVKKPKMKRTAPRGGTRAAIFAAMLDIAEPASSKTIANRVHGSHPEVTEKMVWNALYNMRMTKHVLRNGSGLYHLHDYPNKVAEAG